MLSVGDGDTITVRLDMKTTDRCGRTVAEVMTGTNINLAKVDDGPAFAHRRDLDQCASRKFMGQGPAPPCWMPRAAASSAMKQR
ncbi:hypothetical protein KBY96_11395 [Cyanobium sp. ATX 6A2]|uniref:thermonuclease family protein n=1 Tax=Cyanobium sp. ATX 6A2 TaxID=2823700 RepID=UPI0020CF5216|nr:thermonuclease family protein [Cyanobium sp. ATX 6A2]MCP9888530.1 hypothetical protein [Cyanobium sp. ATX 6A2]